MTTFSVSASILPTNNNMFGLSSLTDVKGDHLQCVCINITNKQYVWFIVHHQPTIQPYLCDGACGKSTMQHFVQVWKGCRQDSTSIFSQFQHIQGLQWHITLARPVYRSKLKGASEVKSDCISATCKCLIIAYITEIHALNGDNVVYIAKPSFRNDSNVIIAASP